MTEELKSVGVDVGHRRVGRLMRENGIVVERTRKFKAITDSDHTFNIAPNPARTLPFTADRPNRKWAGDISYIWTREGWLYLALDHGPRTDGGHVSLLDLHSGRVIGLGRQQPHETQSGHPGLDDGHRTAIPATRLHLPQRSRQPRLFA